MDIVYVAETTVGAERIMIIDPVVAREMTTLAVADGVNTGAQALALA